MLNFLLPHEMLTILHAAFITNMNEGEQRMNEDECNFVTNIVHLIAKFVDLLSFKNFVHI